MRKIFYLLLVFVLILFACSAGCVASDYDNVATTSSAKPTAQPTVVKQVSFEEKFISEFENTREFAIADITKVTVKDRKLTVYIQYDIAWNKEQMRKYFAIATNDILTVAVNNYPDRFDYITVAGEATLQDTKGNQYRDVVYTAETTMDNAKSVNWQRMSNYKDPVEALNYNLKVRWHGSLRP